MTGVWEWKGRGSLGNTGSGDEKWVSPSGLRAAGVYGAGALPGDE